MIDLEDPKIVRLARRRMLLTSRDRPSLPKIPIRGETKKSKGTAKKRDTRTIPARKPIRMRLRTSHR